MTKSSNWSLVGFGLGFLVMAFYTGWHFSKDLPEAVTFLGILAGAFIGFFAIIYNWELEHRRKYEGLYDQVKSDEDKMLDEISKLNEKVEKIRIFGKTKET